MDSALIHPKDDISDQYDHHSSTHDLYPQDLSHNISFSSTIIGGYHHHDSALQQALFSFVYSRYYLIFYLILFIAQLGLIIYGTIEYQLFSAHPKPEALWYVIVDFILVALMIIEIGFRIGAAGTLRRYFRAPHNLVDFIAVVLSLGTLIFYSIESDYIIISIIITILRYILRISRLVMLIRQQHHHRQVLLARADSIDLDIDMASNLVEEDFLYLRYASGTHDSDRSYHDEESSLNDRDGDELFPYSLQHHPDHPDHQYQQQQQQQQQHQRDGMHSHHHYHHPIGSANTHGDTHKHHHHEKFTSSSRQDYHEFQTHLPPRSTSSTSPTSSISPPSSFAALHVAPSSTRSHQPFHFTGTPTHEGINALPSLTRVPSGNLSGRAPSFQVTTVNAPNLQDYPGHGHPWSLNSDDDLDGAFAFPTPSGSSTQVLNRASASSLRPSTLQGTMD